VPGLFFLESAGRAKPGGFNGVCKSGVALRLLPHSQACLAKLIAVRCPQPGTGVGEMVEAKIVGKNENNIRLGRIA